MFPGLFTDVSPPGQGTIFALAHTATAARYKVPAQWLGAMVTFTSSGSDLYLVFGDANVKADSAKYSQVVSEVLAPHWGTGILIPAGATVSFPVAANCTHFSVDSSGATGSWSAFRSSGEPTFGEFFPASLPAPSLWLDIGLASSVSTSSGITQVVDQSANRAIFAEATNKPALNDAAAVGSGLMRPAAAFTAGSSHKLVCSDTAIAGLFDGTDAFTLCMPVRRGATGAVHTLFGVGTDGSANGHWDLALDGSDDILLTRVDSAGASTTSVYATTVNTTPILITLVYDGSAPVIYVNRSSVSLTGTATGDLGTASKVSIGARIINTSTYANFATAEIPEVIAFNSALSTAQLAKLHDWMQRRYAL